MQLNKLTLIDAINLLSQKKIKIEEIYGDIDAEIKKHNQELNIFLNVNNNAQKEAEMQAEKLLKGLPIAVKDNFLTKNLATTAASKLLVDFKPPYESTVTQKLKFSGAVVNGKTNMDAWAHGSSTETSDFGATKNPRNSHFLPGGSSGGSAAAVAADMCIAAIGSETAGSIRQPAAWCGVVGLKPTYGRVSRAGVIAMGSSLDSPGPMGKSVADTAFLLNLIAGKDQYDGTTSSNIVPDFTKNLQQGVKGLRVGICYIDHHGLKNAQVANAVKKASQIFSTRGAEVEEVSLSDSLQKNKILNPDYAIGLYTVLQRSEVSSNLARYDGIRYGNPRSFFGVEAKRRIMLGTFTLSAGYADKFYMKALQVRTLYIKNYSQLFQ